MWSGGISRDGRYGSVSYRNRNCRVHRVAYELANGPIPPGLEVLHSCDRPLCVNPEHLSVGTNADNVTDKVAKNRQAKGVGCRHPHRVFTEALVLELRRLRSEGWGLIALTRRYRCTKQCIMAILKGRTWRHVS